MAADRGQIQQSSDGWYGLGNDTIAREKAEHTSSKQSPGPAAGSMASIYAPQAAAESSASASDPSGTAKAPVSLSSRLGIEESKPSAPSSSGGDTPRASPQLGAKEEISPPAAQRTRPPKLDLPKTTFSMATHHSNRLGASSPGPRTPIAQTPLSETHPPPETPLKHDWQRGSSNELQLTPRTEEALGGSLSSRQSRGGLLLDPGSGLLPKALQTPPVTKSLQLHAEDAPYAADVRKTTASSSLSTESIAAENEHDGEPRAAAASPPPVRQDQSKGSSARSQIDDMLAKLRATRSNGSQASMWARKEEEPINDTGSLSTAAARGTDAAPTAPAKPSRRLADRNDAAIAGAHETSSSTSDGRHAKKPAPLMDRLGPALASADPSSDHGSQLAPDSSPELDKNLSLSPKKERRSRAKSSEHRTIGPSSRSLLDRMSAAPNAEQSLGAVAEDDQHVGPSQRRKQRDNKASEGNLSKPRKSNGRIEKEKSPARVPEADTATSTQTSPKSSAAPLVASTRGTETMRSAEVPKAPVEESAEEERALSVPPTPDPGSDSVVGNETTTTFNWGDDDDDELDPLPEGWGEAAAASSPEMQQTAFAAQSNTQHRAGADGKKRVRRSGVNLRKRREGGTSKETSPNLERSQGPRFDRERNKGKELFEAPTSSRSSVKAKDPRAAGPRSGGKEQGKQPRELFPDSAKSPGKDRSNMQTGSKNGKPRSSPRLAARAQFD